MAEEESPLEAADNNGEDDADRRRAAEEEEEDDDDGYEDDGRDGDECRRSGRSPSSPSSPSSFCAANAADDKSGAARRIYRGEGLAPMVRCGTLPLRSLALQYGADFCYTEEIVDKSLIECARVVRALPSPLPLPSPSPSSVAVVDYEKDLARMSAKVRSKHDGLPPLQLRIDPALERGRLVCQLGTADPDLALRAALVVHRDVASIDVNMGCPKKFSTAGGMGSALLSDPQRACSIVRNLDSHLPVPVSAKIRLLKTPRDTVEFASALVGAGAAAIAVHGRRVGDLDVRDSDRQALREVVSVLAQKFPTVPICANGDFYTRSEIQSFREETSASAVLLARPALYNASLFLKPPPDAAAATSALYGYDSPLLLDRTNVVQEYVRHAARYQAHWKNAKYVVCEMLNVRRTPTSRVHELTWRDLQQQQQQQQQQHSRSSPAPPRLPFQKRSLPPAEGAAAAATGAAGTPLSLSPPPPWTRPTIGQTCACKSLEALCDLWGVRFPEAEMAATGEPEDWRLADSRSRAPEPSPPPGERAYSDSYLLRNAHEAPAATSSPPSLRSSATRAPSGGREDGDDSEEDGPPPNPKKPRGDDCSDGLRT